MPQTTVNRGANGQFKTTVPKGLAEAFDLDGKRIDWSVASGNKFEVTIVDE